MTRKERRQKYLDELDPDSRRKRDEYVGWLSRWRKEYNNLTAQICWAKHGIKRTTAQAIREHNQRLHMSSSQSQRFLTGLRFRARAMMEARTSFTARMRFWREFVRSA